MANLYIGKYATRQKPVKYPDCAGDLVVNRFELDIAKDLPAGTVLGVGDIIDLGVLPGTTRFVDAYIDTDKLDTNGTPAMAFDVGMMSGAVGSTDPSRTCGNEIFAAANTAQAGGLARMTKNVATRLARTGADQSIGVKITAAAATQAATGILSINVIIEG